MSVVGWDHQSSAGDFGPNQFGGQFLSRGKLAAPILATAWMLSGGPLSFRMDPAPPAMVVAIPVYNGAFHACRRLEIAMSATNAIKTTCGITRRIAQ